MKKATNLFQQAYDDIVRQEDRRVFADIRKALGPIIMEISTHPCSFGYVLIGVEHEHLTSVELGSSPDECFTNFSNRWYNHPWRTSQPTNTLISDRVLQVIESGVPDDKLKINLYTGTPFQRKIWEQLQNIEWGQTISYKDIAEKANVAQAYRAVGTACGANPIAIVVPCHRVLPSGGSLGGYRWGKDIKKKLLQREGIVI